MFNLTGTTLGKYEITERLGRGGMADVYKAIHVRLGTDVAIKVLYSHLVEQEDFLARFEREARAAASLRHPNIVRVFDYEVENELYYIVMDFVDGGTLKEKISAALQQGEYLSYPEVMRIFRQAAEALDYAHQQGMVHRDVKSANILLEEAGGAYLTDFGIAHIVSSTHLTATGSLIGTPIYMSPEQCQGKKATPLSDIYSLGMVLYEMLTAQVPFADDTPLAVIHKHIYDPMPSPRSFRPDLPEKLEAVIIKSLEREPQDRYERPADFLAALSAVMQEDFDPQTVAIPVPEKKEENEVDQTEPEPEREISSQQTVADLSAQDYLEPPDFEHLAVVEKPKEQDAVQPTVMKEYEAVTVVEDELEAQPSKPPPVKDDQPGEEEREAATVVAEGTPAPIPQEIKFKTPPPARKKLSRGAALAIIAGGLVIILLLVALLTHNFPGIGPNDTSLCSSPQDCLDTAWFYKEEGDEDMVENTLIRMERLMDPDEPAMYAFMFCEAGEIYLHLDQPGSARGYFEHCLESAGEHPELEDLREYARTMLEHIE